MLRIKNFELWLSLAAIVIITVGYWLYTQANALPESSGLVGHLLGVFGFLLMLMTEILYSLRKRYQFARWGKMKNWLAFHIFTGLVGPYMVFLHTAFEFRGLAGILTLMTAVIVASGFVGRYFYTAIPRSVDQQALNSEQVLQETSRITDQIKTWEQDHPELIAAARQKGASLSAADRRKLSEYQALRQAQNELTRKSRNLVSARRLLSVWHSVHIPLGIATFTVAFIHIGAALYYATLLK